MENTDFELINRTISGDQDAFATLVRKYQKRVHALAWRKTGDFHVAEDITQDTFLRAYRKLSTLKNPNLFAGWLYVIANRLCSTWFEKKAPQMQSLDAMPPTEIEEFITRNIWKNSAKSTQPKNGLTLSNVSSENCRRVNES
jgi:RNA polymerase sigma factor (sigma-70 family)